VAAVLARSDTTSYTAWRVLGEAQIALGKGPRAVHSLRRALALQPRSAVARLMLERLGEKP
jgi:cytochrome c-type biogenesis protein CcmH/NrfG